MSQVRSPFALQSVLIAQESPMLRPHPAAAAIARTTPKSGPGAARGGDDVEFTRGFYHAVAGQGIF
jgi:hypothetical protein